MLLKLCTYVSCTSLEWAELFRKVFMEYFSSNYQNCNRYILKTLCYPGHSSFCEVKDLEITKHKHLWYHFSHVGRENIVLYDDISFPCTMRQLSDCLAVSTNFTDIPHTLPICLERKHLCICPKKAPSPVYTTKCMHKSRLI